MCIYIYIISVIQWSIGNLFMFEKLQSLLLQNVVGWKRASFIKRLGSEGYVDPKFSSDMMLLEDSDDAGWFWKKNVSFA